MGVSPSAADKSSDISSDNEGAIRREIFACSPLPMLLISIDEMGERPGAYLTTLNDAARALFPFIDAPLSEQLPLSSILDTKSVRRIDEAASHLFDLPSSDPLRIDVQTKSESNDPDSADYRTMYLQRVGLDQLVAQIVPSQKTAEVHEVLEEQRRFRSAILELAELANTTDDDETFYHRLIERAVEVVPGAQGGSVQLNIEGTKFRFVAAVGYDLAGLQLHNLDTSEFFRDAHDPEAQIVRDMMRGKTEEMHDWLVTYGRVDDIVVNVSSPVVVDGKTVAFLSLDNFEDANALDQSSVEMTTVLGRLIGDLWRRRQLESKLRREREAFRHEALHDLLTSLPNRRDLEQRLREGISNQREAGRPTAVLFADIDSFKEINDQFGHDAGDAVLCDVADWLSEVVGSVGVVGRWGGDEFIILPNDPSSLEAMEDLASRILRPFNNSLRPQRTVALSVGIAWCADGSASARDLRTAADQALYEAKGSGKQAARTRVLGESLESSPQAA